MKESPLKQNYSKKRSVISQIFDPAGIHKKSAGAPAIVPGSAFKMKGYAYPGKSPLRAFPAGEGKGKKKKNGWWKKTKTKAGKLLGSELGQELAVGAVVGMLSKPKKEYEATRIVGDESEGQSIM